MRYLTIKNLSVDYGAGRVLEGVNLTVDDDDFLGVIGPNGGGKTTLIKAMLGRLPVGVTVSGTIEYAPELSRDGHKAIGYLPQQNGFDSSFPISVREVILSGLQSSRGFAKRYSTNDKQRVVELAQTTGIEAIMDAQIGEISGGQLQRTLLCRALISDPRLLILDEPANFVDNKFEGELYRLLEELNHRMAIIMVSHDLGTISSVVKNIVCVNCVVHRHNSNLITAEQLENYNCPIQLVSHGHVPHTVLETHEGHSHE